MRFRQLSEKTILTEAGDVGNFADQAEQVHAGIGAAAARAYGKFKGHYTDAQSKIKSDAISDAKDAEAAAKKAKKTSGNKIAGSVNIVCDIIFASTPGDEEDIAPVKDLDADQLNSFLNVVEKVQGRLLKIPAVMMATLRASEFLNSIDKTPIKLKELCSDQPENKLDAPEALLMQNKSGEQQAWRLALGTDDAGAAGKALLNMVARVSRENEAKNMASTGTGHAGGKTYAEGTALINMLSAQRQVLEARIIVLKDMIEKHASKVHDDDDDRTMTEGLRRIRKLVKRL